MVLINTGLSNSLSPLIVEFYTGGLPPNEENRASKLVSQGLEKWLSG